MTGGRRGLGGPGAPERPRQSGRSDRLGRPPRSRLVLRAIGWRLSSSVAFLAIAIVAVTAAAAGPLYLTGADQSIVSGALADSSPSQTGVTISDAPGKAPASPAALLVAASSIPGGAGNGAHQRFGAPIVTTDVASSIFSPVSGRPDGIQLVFRTGACQEVSLVSGHCPSAPAEVAVSSRTAEQLRAVVGTVLHLSDSGRSAAVLPPVALVVSGLYRAGNPNAPIWWGTNYFPFGGSGAGSGAEQLDAGWLSAAGAARLSAVRVPTSWLQLALRPDAITAPNLSTSLDQLGSWESTVQASDAVVIGSDLPSVLTAAQTEESSAGTVAFVVSLMLVLLALLVLFSVAQATSELRANDVRVAELRGLPRRRVAVLALREPVLLLVCAVPAGIALAWAVLSILDAQLLGIAAPRFSSLAIAAGALTLVAGIVAATLGSRTLLRWRISEEPAVAAATRRSRNTAVADALGVALAVAGGAELIARGNRPAANSDLLALLGPGLLALGAGILGARLLPLAAAGLARATRWTRHVAVELAVLSVKRRESVARRVVVPTIAAGLLVFSIAGIGVSRRNDAMQAGFGVGAPVVLQAEVRPGVDFLDAVRAADPGGREAMAVVNVQASYGNTLAVDASRLAAIAAWPRNLSAAPVRAIAAALAPPVAAPVIVPGGSRLVLSVDLATPVLPRPDLQLDLFDRLYSTESQVDFGLLQPGTHSYSVSVAGDCVGGCRMDSFTLVWVPGPRVDPLAHQVTLRLISLRSVSGGSSQALPVGFSRPAYWKGSDGATTSSSPSGLFVVSDLTSAIPPTIAPDDAPAHVPAVVTSAFVTLNANPAAPSLFAGVGIDQNQINLRSVAVVPALPGLGANGTMIDLGLAQVVQTGPPAGSQFEVWCASPPGAGLIARLDQRGVSIVGSASSSAALRRYQRSGASLGFDLFGLAGVAALLLALGALLFATASSARSRGIELSGLAAAGVPRRALARSIAIESLMVSVVGALLGWGAGVAAASLALGSLPEFPAGRVGPPLELGLPWAGLFGAGGAAIIVLAAAAVGTASIVMAQVRPDRLRMSP